jgi:benzodiazapine receptor
MWKNMLIYIAAILMTEGAGLAGSIFTTPNIQTWYAGLLKPAFNPPNWIFGPVWTILFLMMGISLALVIISGKNSAFFWPAVAVFAVQLALNILWSFVFFYLHNPLYGFIEIIFLLLAIALTIFYFYKINHVAAWMLVPYILWVSFATILTASIWRLNIVV